MNAYYNEFEPFAAEWLKNLIAKNLIAPGDVDTRSITDVRSDDLKGYTQCHFFAGIGGWSYALRLAGWSDYRPVWTGSCPCQPFSSAGKQRGSEDERHLWPAFFNLIRECRPATVFGEQVAGAAGLAWLDHVCADLEGESYAVAAADLPACSVGAPHRRQRLWWVASLGDSAGGRPLGTVNGRERDARGAQKQHARGVSSGRVAHSESGNRGLSVCERGSLKESIEPKRSGEIGGVDDSQQRTSELYGYEVAGTQGTHQGAEEERQRIRDDSGNGCATCLVGDAERIGQPRPWQVGRSINPAPGQDGKADRADHASHFDPWADLDWLPCSDGKARPTKPCLFPLAYGVPGRVGKLRAAGNAIVPQVAAEFVKAFMECQP